MKTVYLKFGLALVTVLSFTFGNSQTTDPSDDVAQTDAENVSVRLIDNKGTIKYLQSNNGITNITSTEAGNLTTTTWQLGGTLVDSTYIDTSGAIFVLDGISLETGAASTNAVNDEIAKGGGATGTGWTFLVRDEATGETRKLEASEIVDSGSVTNTAATDTLSGTFTITATGLPATPSTLWVYRNGAKLVSGVDYTASAVNTVTLTVSPGTGVANWVSYTGDVYEVYWVK